MKKVNSLCLILMLLLTLHASGAEFEKIFMLKEKTELEQKDVIIGGISRGVIDRQLNIYSYDSHSACILKFSRNGKFLTKIGKLGSGPGEFKLILGISLDSKDRLYTLDVFKFALQVFDGSGKLVEFKKFTRPWYNVFVNPKTDTVILEVSTLKGKCRAVMYNRDYSVEKCILKETRNISTDQPLTLAFSLEFDQNGNGYAIDGVVYKIHVFDRNGNIKHTFGAPSKKFKPMEGKAPLPVYSERYRKWWDSFCAVYPLQITANDYALAYYSCGHKRDRPRFVDIYKTTGKKLAEDIKIPDGYKPFAKDHEGFVYFLKTDISDDGTEVDFWLYKYALNEKYLKTKMKGK